MCIRDSHTGGHRCFTSCRDGHGGVAYGTARPCTAVDLILVVMDAAAVVARRRAPVRQARACVRAARKPHHRAVPLPARGRAEDVYKRQVPARSSPGHRRPTIDQAQTPQ